MDRRSVFRYGSRWELLSGESLGGRGDGLPNCPCVRSRDVAFLSNVNTKARRVGHAAVPTARRVSLLYFSAE